MPICAPTYRFASTSIRPRRRRIPASCGRQLVGVVKALVGDRDEHPRHRERPEQLRETGRRRRLRVVEAPPLAAVDALVGDAVARRGVPADERLPDVVVREERVLVVGRVEVDEIDVERRREEVGIEPRDGAGRAGDRLGQPQAELVVGAGRPRLQIGHLQARRAVDAVCRLEQRGEQDAPLERRERVAVDRVADRVDPGAVLRLQVARLPAEGLGEVPLAALERRELRDDRGEAMAVERPVGDDVGLPDCLRIGREVVRVHGEPEAAQRLPDPRRPGEEVAGRPDGQLRGYPADQRHERAFRPEVLDHRCSSNGALRRWPQMLPLD